MKSRPLESKNNMYETACKNCLFAIYDGKTQVGCQAGRIDRYKDLDQVFDAYDDTHEFYVIKGICNAVRENGWNNDVAEVEKMRAENRPRFDVILDATHINKRSAEEWMSFYDEVRDSDFTVDFCVIAPDEFTGDQRKLVSEVLRHIDCPVIESNHVDMSITERILSSKRAFTVVMDSISLPVPNMFNRIDILLNEDLRKFVLYSLDGTTAISNLAFHIYQKKLDTLNYYDVLEEVFEEAMKLELIITEVED